MDCAETLTDTTASLTLEQAIEFLEPTETRGGAVCMSAEDFTEIKTTIQTACEKLRACNHEKVGAVLTRLDELQKKAKAKRKPPHS